MDEILKNRNLTIDTIKGVAIFCVVCAHCNAVSNDSNIIAQFLSNVLSYIGTWGVGCLFFVSGVLYSRPNNILVYLKKRLYKIGCPWMISSIIVYLYVYLRKSQVDFKSFLLFFIGNGSYLYYLTVLFGLYFLYCVFPLDKKWISYCFVIISFISSTFFYDLIPLTPYLNIFNWIGYFSFGVLLSVDEIDCIKNYIIGSKTKYVCLYMIVVVCIMIVFIIDGHVASYFGGVNSIFTFLGTVLVFFISLYLCDFSWIRLLGEKSLFIYLWHMPLAGIVAHVFNLNSVLQFFILFRPLIIIGTLYMIILVLNRSGNKNELLHILGY